MGVDWKTKFADRVGGLHGSMTRKLMSVLDDPEIISLGGGLSRVGSLSPRRDP